MKIVYFYFLKLFLKQILIIQTVILTLYTFFIIIGHMDMIDRYGATIANVIYYDLIKIPRTIYDTMPITVVAATLLVVITLIKQNELIAFVSIGGKLRNIAIPFVLVGIIITIIMFYLSETVNPKVDYLREKYKTEVIEKKRFYAGKRLRNLWIKDGKRDFLNVALIDPIGKRFEKLKKYFIDEDYKVYKILQADEGVFKDGKWVFINEKIFYMRPVPTLIKYNLKSIKEDKTLTSLMTLPEGKRNLTLKDYETIISIYKDKGLNVDEYLLFYYKKFAHPLSIIILILSVLPISITLSRQHSYVAIASKALSTGFAYWILNAMLFALTEKKLMSPFLANFLPHILLIIFAFFIIVRREHGS